jgi:hypothetical protein
MIVNAYTLTAFLNAGDAIIVAFAHAKKVAAMDGI